MSWIGVLIIVALVSLIVPELLLIPVMVLGFILEFILRLFGKSFDDLPSNSDD